MPKLTILITLVALLMGSTPLLSQCVDSCQVVYAPNTFTPDHNGHNDVFVISTHNIKQAILTIHNQWGAVVYQTDTLVWTGDCGTGYYCCGGIYYWTLLFPDYEGAPSKRHGTILLVK